jgi:uncharacterized membrane protein
MTTLTVWRFGSADRAEAAVAVLRDLSRERLIVVDDAAVVSWPEGRKSPRTRQLRSLARAGALGGAFWGFLFGLVFFVPLLGLAAGAAIGAFGGALTDVGIDDDFIASLRDRIGPGSSALFVLTSAAVIDKVHDAFGPLEPELIHSNLSEEDEGRLRAIFEGDPAED